MWGGRVHSALNSLIADPISSKLLSKPGTELSHIDSRLSALSENSLFRLKLLEEAAHNSGLQTSWL